MKTNKAILLIGVFFPVAFSLFSQTGKRNMPEEKISVNKETDENGNIIRYDSTYTYSWSGAYNNKEKIDSVLKEFNQRLYGFDNTFFHDFNFSYPHGFFHKKNDPFLNYNMGFNIDSILNKNFQEMEKMLWQMNNHRSIPPATPNQYKSKQRPNDTKI